MGTTAEALLIGEERSMPISGTSIDWMMMMMKVRVSIKRSIHGFCVANVSKWV